MAIQKLADPTTAEKCGNLYVIRSASGPVKVGHSEKPHLRVSHLQAATLEHLTLEYVHPVFYPTRMFAEKYAHELLWQRRIRGEWFDVEVDQAVAAIRLAVKGTDAGRLPPGPCGNGKHGSKNSHALTDTLRAVTGSQFFAMKRYRAALHMAANDNGRWVGDRPALARGLLNEVHAQVRAEMGEIGVTLLGRVVGMGQAVRTLPGSGRQHAKMTDFVCRALDIVWRLDNDPEYPKVGPHI